MSILVILIVAVSLSMDAFSLSLIYGTLNLDKKIEITTSIIVGLFHFFMPILGLLFGKIIIKIIPFDPNIIVGLIFIGLAIEMIISNFKELHPIATLWRVSIISPLIIHSWFFVFNSLILSKTHLGFREVAAESK